MDTVANQNDFSSDPRFADAVTKKVLRSCLFPSTRSDLGSATPSERLSAGPCSRYSFPDAIGLVLIGPGCASPNAVSSSPSSAAAWPLAARAQQAAQLVDDRAVDLIRRDAPYGACRSIALGRIGGRPAAFSCSTVSISAYWYSDRNLLVRHRGADR
jgi:hypothetical protein